VVVGRTVFWGLTGGVRRPRSFPDDGESGFRVVGTDTGDGVEAMGDTGDEVEAMGGGEEDGESG